MKTGVSRSWIWTGAALTRCSRSRPGLEERVPMIRVRDLSAAEDATKSGAPAKADALRISGVEQIASSLGPEHLRACRGGPPPESTFAVHPRGRAAGSA